MSLSKNEAERKRLLKNRYRAVFITAEATPEEAKFVLLDMLKFSNYIDADYVKGDIEQTAVNAGMKIIMANILELLDLRGYAELLEFEREGIDLLDLYPEEER